MPTTKRARVDSAARSSKKRLFGRDSMTDPVTWPGVTGSAHKGFANRRLCGGDLGNLRRERVFGPAWGEDVQNNVVMLWKWKIYPFSFGFVF